MRRLAATALLLLAACAQAPSQRGNEAPAQYGETYRARIHTELAAQYYSRGQYAVALQELHEALRSDAAHAPAYDMRALVHIELGEDKEAEDNFRHAIELSGEYPEAHNNYGYFLCQRGRFEEAMTQFEKAWKNPLYASPEKALANAGRCALLSGDVTAADRYAQRALTRAPNHPVALLTQAEVGFRQGNATLARSQLRLLETQGGLDAPALWLGVRIERRLGNQAAEADYGLQLRRRFPNSQETRWLIEARYEQGGGKP
jgi:type IV pilus assembly protein PilF